MQISLTRASQQDGTYPRPQLVRSHWVDVTDRWEFAFDDEDRGLEAGWHLGATALAQEIQLPFPPESRASGIGDPGFHHVAWYRRVISQAELDATGRSDERGLVVLRFGAVDYSAQVWADGRLLGRHEGGQTPFAFELPADLAARPEVAIVVRVQDDPADVAQPRGKQDWLEDPHVIWYHRTTGIWQPVWLEAVAPDRLERLTWRTDVPGATVDLTVRFARRPVDTMQLQVELTYDGAPLASASVPAADLEQTVTLHLARQRNGQSYEGLLWSPDHPRLIDAVVRLVDGAGRVLDEVGSYLGLRSIATSGRSLLLNDRPVVLRSVLEQGYWPESHLAAPSAEALRAEVELIRALGFNSVRLHEKAEDPRLLYWTDRLGVLVWSEIASAFEFAPRAVERTVREWMDIIARDASHPSIVTWVPVNESWGVQHVAHDPSQRHYVQALYHLTKALDPTRLTVSNDGWEHADTDLLTIHDYADSGAVLADRYAADALDTIADEIGPAGRRLTLLPTNTRTLPILVTEFGGISFAPGAPADSWGYSVADSEEDFERRLDDVIGAVRDAGGLAGFCYTQLTDTEQETNGLTDEHRRPKIPIERIRAIVTGSTGCG
ncbi:glycoside hydrolase family 2 protein [Microbacterium atlanticum]|uniref:glycoside hydrolase family 2 protein n=1 Tax=Microbacterium atlanticum TaxID=2782168 RepID=UPI00188756AA|nr:glycoside hydrolase family 2 TIM barrel-domain containing protein [Microbacterium atlanticum]